MAVVTIKSVLDYGGEDASSGLFTKIFSTDTNDISGGDLIGADGKLASGINGAVNEAEFFVVGASGYAGDTAIGGEGDALAVTKFAKIEMTSALTVGAKLYMNNTTAGTAGQIVSDTTATGGDQLKEVGFVVPDSDAAATSTWAVISITKPGTNI